MLSHAQGMQNAFTRFMAENGYQTKTTFFFDLTIADAFGKSAVKDTIARAEREWMDNIEYITELCLAVNHKSWQWHERNAELCELYASEYWRLQDAIYEHYAKDQKALEYYYSVTD